MSDTWPRLYIDDVEIKSTWLKVTDSEIEIHTTEPLESKTYYPLFKNSSTAVLKTSDGVEKFHIKYYRAERKFSAFESTITLKTLLEIV